MLGAGLPEIRAELQDTCARLGAVFRSEAFLRWAPPELAASSAHLLALSGGPSGPVLALPEAPGSDEVPQYFGAIRTVLRIHGVIIEMTRVEPVRPCPAFFLSVLFVQQLLRGSQT